MEHPHYQSYKRMFDSQSEASLRRMKQSYLDMSQDSVDPPELNEFHVFLSKVCDDILEDRCFDPA